MAFVDDMGALIEEDLVGVLGDHRPLLPRQGGE
jgi:hypothetical protein